MEFTLGETTKFLENIMANYSQWHTERAPTSKKVNLVEELSTLSEKIDALMKLVGSKNSPIDPNDVPLSTLIEQNNDPVDVNFVSRTISVVMLIEVISILGRFQEIPLTIMAIPMVIIIIT